MSLPLDEMLALTALGPKALMIGQCLLPVGAYFEWAEGEQLSFTVYLDQWIQARGLDSVEREFPGIGGLARHAEVSRWMNEYECIVTVSLIDDSVRASVEGMAEMGNCDECQSGDEEECFICLQRGELPSLSEAVEETCRDLVAQAINALGTPEPTPPAARKRSR